MTALRPTVEVGHYQNRPGGWTNWLATGRHPTGTNLGWVIFLRDGELFFMPRRGVEAGSNPKVSSYSILSYSGTLNFIIDETDWNRGSDDKPDWVHGVTITTKTGGRTIFIVRSYSNGLVELVVGSKSEILQHGEK